MIKCKFVRYCYFIVLCGIHLLESHAQDLRHPEAYIQAYDSAYRYPYPKRWDVIELIHPVLFKHLGTKEGLLFRNKIEELAARHHKDEKGVLIAQISKMDYLQRTSKVPLSEFENWYKMCINEADRLRFEETKASFAFLYAANLTLNYQKDVLALYYLHKSVEYSEATKHIISPIRREMLFVGLSRIFYQFDDFASAINYGKEVEKYNLGVAYKFLTLDVIGMSYLKTKSYQNALLYFNKGLKMYQKFFAKDSSKLGWKGILVGKKAHVYKAIGQLDSAIYYYKIGIEDTRKHQLLDNTCGFAINLADIYLTQKKIKEVAPLVTLAQESTRKQGNEFDKFQLHQLLSRYYTSVGNFPLALQHKDSTRFWDDVLEERRGKNVQIQADLQLETERRRNTELRLVENIRQQQISRIVAIVIVLLLSLVVFVLILRQKLLIKVKEKELEIQRQEVERQNLIEQEKAKRDLIIAQMKLEEFTNIIIAKNRQIELLRAENTKTDDSFSIQQLRNNTLLTDEQWENFKNLFDKVHVGFLHQLREKIPGISPAEVRCMALAKLRLDNKEMAFSLGISVNAVRNVWYRLRKKIDLPEDATWGDIVDMIS